jgi:SAM-dependent methyltransferase
VRQRADRAAAGRGRRTSAWTSPTRSCASARRAGLRVARADVTRLPVADAAVDVVLCSMALQLLPLAPALAEVRRVLRPGGTFVATVPTSRPMPVSDALCWARVLVALRSQGLSYPNDDALAAPDDRFAAAGPRPAVGRVARLRPGRRVAGRRRPAARRAVPPGRTARPRDGRPRVVHGWVGRRTTVPVRRLVAQG